MKQTIEKLQKAGVKLTTNKGEFTRPSAAKIAAVELTAQGENINAETLDNWVFENMYFTLSGNKTKGTSKNSNGNAKLFQRLDNYLNADRELFCFDRFTDTLSFTDRGRAKLLSSKRSRVKLTTKRAFEDVTFKARKSIVTKGDHKKVSPRLIDHLK